MTQWPEQHMYNDTQWQSDLSTCTMIYTVSCFFYKLCSKCSPFTLTYAVSRCHHWLIAVSITCCSRSFQMVTRSCQTFMSAIWCSYDVINRLRTTKQVEYSFPFPLIQSVKIHQETRKLQHKIVACFLWLTVYNDRVIWAQWWMYTVIHNDTGWPAAA